MKLNLNDMIGRPGARKPFRFELDLSPLDFVQVSAMHGPFPAEGEVVNVAGALELRGTLAVDMTCLCDRCMSPMEIRRTLPVTAYLAEELVDEENPDIFLLEGGEADLDEVFTTAFVLDMESKIVCGDDCLGLCTTCGANLNDGPCGCKEEIDPRLAALSQLLDGDET